MASDTKAATTDLAHRLSTLRRLLNLSQRQLAKEFNVTPGAIANWESGTRPIPGAVIRLIEIYEENLGMLDRPSEALDKINANWVSRTWRSSMTSAKIAAKLAQGNLRQIVAGNERAAQIKQATDAALADEIVRTLGELKGLMMKLGQMMVYMNFAIPRHVRIALEALQDSTVPMSADQVERVFVAAYGRRPHEIFRSFETYPFAAASIGQVHRGELRDGTKVAIKVQYPEVATALKSDLRNAAILEKLSEAMFRYQDKGAFVGELRDRLLEECDYRLEADNLELFREIFADDPRIVVPRVHRELSRETVLVTDLCEGRRFREFVENADQEQRNAAGETIFHFTFKSLWQHGVFNCDPNAGNFLFQDGKVVFLDFGCVKRFSNDFIDRWKRMSAAALQHDMPTLAKLGKEMGLFPRPESIDVDHHCRSALTLYEPWLTDAPYAFTPGYAERTWHALVKNNPDKYKLALPKDWVFTTRLQWGICVLLGELQAKSNWHRSWKEYSDFEIYKEKADAL